MNFEVENPNKYSKWFVLNCYFRKTNHWEAEWWTKDLLNCREVKPEIFKERVYAKMAELKN